MEGDCQKAMTAYREVVESNPNNRDVRVWIARCQLALGDAAVAEATLTEVLRVVPALPKARSLLAVVYAEMGRTDAAIEQLQAALAIWKDADPEYIPAREARTRLAELEAAG
jgi:Flp pilus assembly protein TadD